MKTTPTFRIEFRSVTADGRKVGHTPAGWDSTRCGRPNAERLADYVAGLEASTAPGAVNAHLGRTVVGYARVVRQSTGDVVAEYTADLFSVVA